MSFSDSQPKYNLQTARICRTTQVLQRHIYRPPPLLAICNVPVNMREERQPLLTSVGRGTADEVKDCFSNLRIFEPHLLA